MTSFPEVNRKKAIRWPYIILGILIIGAGVVFSFFLYNRIQNNSNVTAEKQEQEEYAQYKSPDGFSITYPSRVQFTETDRGVILNGDGEVVFVIGNLDGQSLAQVVESIARNFGVDENGDLDTVTIDSRMGFMFEYNSAAYYYFPITSENYLEIVDNVGERGDGIISSLKFNPPEATLN